MPGAICTPEALPEFRPPTLSGEVDDRSELGRAIHSYLACLPSLKGLEGHYKKEVASRILTGFGVSGALTPEDLMSAFDLLFLIPLPIFQTDDAFSLEIEKIANSVRQQAVKSQLQTLSEKMKIEEKNGNEEELQKLREAFSLLATNFK
jgi:hypothetical protein